MKLAGKIGSVMSNLEAWLRWTCPRCQLVVEPIMGHTLVKDNSGWRMRCLDCEPRKEVSW